MKEFAQLRKPSAALHASKQAQKSACYIGGTMARRKPRCIETAWLLRRLSKIKPLDWALVQTAASSWKAQTYHLLHEAELRLVSSSRETHRLRHGPEIGALQTPRHYNKELSFGL
jgi:hypothetical protein